MAKKHQSQQTKPEAQVSEEEKKRLEAEAAAEAEKQRLAEEEEAKKQAAAEAEAAEAEKQRLAEEQRKAEEAERKRQAETARKEEEQRLADEEAARLEAEKRPTAETADVSLNTKPKSTIVRTAGMRLLDTQFAESVPALAKQSPALCEALNAFCCELAPNSGSTPQQKMEAQIRFYNTLSAFFASGVDDIRKVNAEIIKTVEKNLDKAFSIAYMNVNMDQLRLTGKQLTLFQSLLHIYRTAASRGFEAVNKEIDLPLIAKQYEDVLPRSKEGANVLKELFRLGN